MDVGDLLRNASYMPDLQVNKWFDLSDHDCRAVDVIDDYVGRTIFRGGSHVFMFSIQHRNKDRVL